MSRCVAGDGARPPPLPAALRISSSAAHCETVSTKQSVRTCARFAMMTAAFLKLVLLLCYLRRAAGLALPLKEAPSRARAAAAAVALAVPLAAAAAAAPRKPRAAPRVQRACRGLQLLGPRERLSTMMACVRITCTCIWRDTDNGQRRSCVRREGKKERSRKPGALCLHQTRPLQHPGPATAPGHYSKVARHLSGPDHPGSRRKEAGQRQGLPLAANTITCCCCQRGLLMHTAFRHDEACPLSALAAPLESSMMMRTN